MHGRIHVVLKESLKKIPVIGWGMSLSKFIFLKRNWEQDKTGLAKHLHSLNKPEDPMWLMFFPEGTNLAPCTREKSKKWAEQNGYKDFQHVLLPRSTGLHFCLLKLRETVEYVYDCTIAYEGVKRGEFAQDIFTIESSWFSGRPPKSVNMHWRRFKISTIPLDDINVFDIWLRARWAEKDAFMEHYMQTGRFPADEGVDQTPEGETRRGAGYIETQVKPYNWYEILQVFAPVATFAIVLFYFYNMALPHTFFATIQDWAGYSEDEIKKKLRIGPPPKLGKPKAITSKTLARTLKPPSAQGDQIGPVKPLVKAKPTQKAPIEGPAPQPKPISAPKAIVKDAPTKQHAIDSSASGKPPGTAAPAKNPAAKATPKPKAPAKTAPAKKPVPEAKATQMNAPKVPSRPKPQPKPTRIKKPLKKTVYPQEPSTNGAAPKKAPTTKAIAAPAPKPTVKAEPPKKPTLLPKTEARRASTHSTTEGWSDITAIDTPWAERPSGKRVLKGQATRKDRVKMEKKQQRLYLEKTAA